jgi:hypothetical protein
MLRSVSRLVPLALGLVWLSGCVARVRPTAPAVPRGTPGSGTIAGVVRDEHSKDANLLEHGELFRFWVP